MKEYTIVFNDDSGKFEMDGKEEALLGNFLYDIAKENNVEISCDSESHQLALIRAANIKVNLLEQDGSKMVW